MEWDWKWFLDIHNLWVSVIFIIFLYFLFVLPKKKYEFIGLGKSSHKKKKKRQISKFEEKCRNIFERLFKVPFIKVRPNWLNNPLTKKNLELDGYNSTVKTPMGYGLAFEADGMQHSILVPYYHKSKADFIYQHSKDNWKEKRCKDLGIILVRVPYYAETENLEQFIVNKLVRYGIYHKINK